jgi:hypothetical protein
MNEHIVLSARLFFAKRTRQDVMNPVTIAILAAALTAVRSTAQNAWERRHLDSVLSGLHLGHVPQDVERLSAAHAAMIAVCSAFRIQPDKKTLARAQSLAKRIAAEIRQQQGIIM